MLYYVLLLLPNYHYIRGLRAALSFGDFELNLLVLIKALETLLNNTGVMHKNIVTFFGLDKAKTFGCIKPFNFTCHNVAMKKMNELKIDATKMVLFLQKSMFFG